MSSRGQSYTIISSGTESGRPRICDSRCSVLYDTLCLFFLLVSLHLLCSAYFSFQRESIILKSDLCHVNDVQSRRLALKRSLRGFSPVNTCFFRAQRSAILFLGSHHLWINYCEYSISATEVWNTFWGTEMYLSLPILYMLLWKQEFLIKCLQNTIAYII